MLSVYLNYFITYTAGQSQNILKDINDPQKTILCSIIFSYRECSFGKLSKTYGLPKIQYFPCHTQIRKIIHSRVCYSAASALY